MEKTFEEKYPQHVKLKSLQTESFVLSEFLDFLNANDIQLAKYGKNDYLENIRQSNNELIGEYLCIDVKALNKEKDDMLGEKLDRLKNKN